MCMSRDVLYFLIDSALYCSFATVESQLVRTAVEPKLLEVFVPSPHSKQNLDT